MTAPLQQQLTPADHQYFDWSTSKQHKIVEQQTNLVQPLTTHKNQRHYYQNYEEKQHLLEDNQLKQNTSTSSNHTNDHIRKKQKINGIESSSSLNTNDEQNQSQQQTCYPFQAELTQKIDIECGSSTNNTPGYTAHTPTHHFTLSTVINVSVNSQTQKSLDRLPSPSQQQQQQYPIKSNNQQDLYVHPSSSSSSSFPSTPLTSYSDLNLYLKDIDLTTFDTFMLPSCPNPQDYLTVDGLLTFLTSDKNSSNEFNKYYQVKQYPMQQMYNYPQTQHYRYPYQQYQMSQPYNYPQQNSSSMIINSPCTSSTTIETGSSSYYRQSSLSQPMTRYYSTTAPTPTYR